MAGIAPAKGFPRLRINTYGTVVMYISPRRGICIKVGDRQDLTCAEWAQVGFYADDWVDCTKEGPISGWLDYNPGEDS